MHDISRHFPALASPALAALDSKAGKT